MRVQLSLVRCFTTTLVIMEEKMVVSKKNIGLSFLLILFFLAQISGSPIQGILIIAVMAISFVLATQNNGLIYILLLLVLQKGFQRVSTGGLYQFITYWDEIVQLFLLVWILINLRKVRYLNKNMFVVLIVYLLHILMLIISTVFYRYATPVKAVLDLFVSSKFMIFAFGGWLLIENDILDRDEFIFDLNRPFKILSVLLFILTIVDVFVYPLFEKFDYRYFTESIQLCFVHPTYLAAVCIFGIAVLILGMPSIPNNMKYIILYVVVTVLTFRTKAIGSIFLIMMVYMIFIKFKLTGKALIFAIMGGLVVYFSYGQIENYFGQNEFLSIRMKMMIDGIDIANNHAPLGAGLATFGTTVAYDSGSKFYYDYNYMSGYYEGQPVGDVFWPGIFAESGWIGTIFFAICVVWLVKIAYQKFSVDKYAAWSMLSIMIYAIVASTSETAFFNPATALMFFIYGIALSDNDKTNVTFE